MADLSWNRIEKALREQQPVSKPKPGPEFWQEFREKAKDLPQDQEVKAPRVIPFPARAAAAAAVFIIAAVGIWHLARQPDPAPIQPPPPVAAVEATEVKSVQVFAPNEGYIIMNDEPDLGAIVWISTADDFISDEDNEL